MRVLSSRDRQESRWRVTGAQQAVAHDPRRTTKDVFISVPTSKMYTTLSHRILHVQLNPFSTFQGAPLRPDCKTDHWRALPAPAIGDAANLCSVKRWRAFSSGSIRNFALPRQVRAVRRIVGVLSLLSAVAWAPKASSARLNHHVSRTPAPASRYRGAPPR